MDRLVVKLKLNDADFTVLYKIPPNTQNLVLSSITPPHTTYAGDAVIKNHFGEAKYLHKHYMLELHLIQNGRGNFYTENGLYEVGKGSCVLVGRNVLHMLQSVPDQPMKRFEILLDYAGGDPEQDVFLRFLQDTNIHIWRRSHHLNALATSMEKELTECQVGFLQNVKAYLTLIFTELMRISKIEESPVQPDDTDEMIVKTYTVIDAFFSSKYQQNVTPDDLASILCVSRRQLHRIMLRYFGSSFKQRLIQVRLDVAKSLLDNSDLPVSRIAEEAGYEYASSFCKAFKQGVGVSPEEYRRQHKWDKNIV